MWNPKKNLQWSEVDAEVVVLDQQGGELFRLDPVAGFIWKQLDGRKDFKEIAQAICQRFDVQEKTACRDLKQFLADLERWDLLERVTIGGE